MKDYMWLRQVHPRDVVHISLPDKRQYARIMNAVLDIADKDCLVELIIYITPNLKCFCHSVTNKKN